MTAPQRVWQRLAWALLASAGVAALGLGVFAVVVDGEGDEPAPTTLPPTTTRVAAPSTTVEVQLSLVTDAPGEVLFTWDGMEFTRDELAGVTERTGVPADHPVQLDAGFVDDQREAGVGYARLERQLQLVANRIGPLAGQEGRPEVAVVSPPVFGERGLATAVLVFNTAAEERPLSRVDLRLLGPDGAPLTEMARFFEGTGIVVPGGTAYFNVIAFAPDQVLDQEPPESFSFESTVEWGETGVQ